MHLVSSVTLLGWYLTSNIYDGRFLIKIFLMLLMEDFIFNESPLEQDFDE